MPDRVRWALVVARVQQGKVCDAWQPGHVLCLATINGVCAMGIEAALGALDPGAQADCVAYDVRRPHLKPATRPGRSCLLRQGVTWRASWSTAASRSCTANRRDDLWCDAQYVVYAVGPRAGRA